MNPAPVSRASAAGRPTMPFAFCGRVSTEDQQDPETSRNWQLARARALIEPVGGVIVEEFFDIGLSRAIPWKRRPEAARLLAALKRPDRGFDAVVIGEPQRAFHGNQFGLTFPLFVHYGVGLWVPEVGGAIDPGSDAHDLVMALYGGISKGERNRIKIRVRAAMAAQTATEGRFLGGRPPYGYRLADAGPHPNPGKAADGRRLHRLEPDPVTAPVVARIYTEYTAGKGLYAIAEALTRDGVPSPSAYDPARNRHRTGVAWSKAAVRVILANPRYTGRQVWNKQRKDEVLIDVDDVALGHQTRMRWNDPDAWIWSDQIVHTPLVSTGRFQAVQELLAAAGHRTVDRKPRRAARHYGLSSLIYCGVCSRRMQGSWNNGKAHYRCVYPTEYALANQVDHPRSLYVREELILPPLDAWLASAFDPPNLAETIHAMHDGQDLDDHTVIAAEHARQAIADADTKLARYRAALESGTDPALIATWTAEVTAAKTTAQAQLRSLTGRRRMTQDEIAAIVTAAGNVLAVLRDADPDDKAAIYRQLGLKLTYQPDTRTVLAEARPPAVTDETIMYETECPRIDTNRNPTRATFVRRHPTELNPRKTQVTGPSTEYCR
jgi:site-specific DNA recombinase